MSKVTSKLQVTIPKELAERRGIAPGDELRWVEAGEGIRLEPVEHRESGASLAERLREFDAATERQRVREAQRGESPVAGDRDRGWSREELYDRGRSR